ncbi:MAG TPA: hypothetical protein VF337_09120, partial [Candidatus Limnocylindrales bacterium]
PADGATAAALVEAADAALYRAKRQRPDSTPGLGVGPGRAPQVASGKWVVAGRELITAGSISGAAAAMASLAGALCGVADVFVALNDEIAAQSVPSHAPVPVAVVVASESGASHGTRMVQVAADGAFAARPREIQTGAGVWGRVWQSGKAEREEDGSFARTGAPLTLRGVVVGVIGVSTTSIVALGQDRSAELAFVAELGSATLERLLDGPAG